MKTKILIILLLFLILQSASAQVPELMTYQGVLTDAKGNRVSDGIYKLTFKIYDSAKTGNLLWRERQKTQVTNGSFSVVLGSTNPLIMAFDIPYWLGATVGNGQEMKPRVQLTSSPYALTARSVADGHNVHSLSTADGDPDAVFVDNDGNVGIGNKSPEEALHVDGIIKARKVLAGAFSSLSPFIMEAPVNVERARIDDTTGNFGIGTNAPVEKLDVAGTAQMLGFKLPTGAGNGLVLTSDINGTGTWQPVSGGGGPFWSLTGNTGTTNTNFLGTTDNQELRLAVNNQTVFRLQPNALSPNVIGGFNGNFTTGFGGTVGGGGSSGGINSAGNFATVGGGFNNTASGQNATIGGGDTHVASGQFATIGGGSDNQASTKATIAGGTNNVASGTGSTISGGDLNQANGTAASVPGGFFNSAAGDYSFAAGRQAKANHNGAFVWADENITDFLSERANQFRVRANGGARFDVTNNDWVDIRNNAGRLINTSTGAFLSTGGTWTNASDRKLKENLKQINSEKVLARLAELPLSTWNYKSNPSVQHIGPMAQDFYSAFGVGSDDEHISTIDADGVALAAIQGLYQQLKTLQEQNGELKNRVSELEAKMK